MSRPPFLVAALALSAAVAAAAQDMPPERLALDIEPGTRTRCRTTGDDVAAYVLLFPRASTALLTRCDAMDESVSRRVQANLEPMLENLGFAIERVANAREAMSEGKDAPDYSAALRVNLHAKPVYLVHESVRYGNQEVVDEEIGVAAWGDFQVWWREGDKVRTETGKVLPVRSEVRDVPGSNPTIDDEEAVARLFADDTARAVNAILTGEPFEPAPRPMQSMQPMPRDRTERVRPAAARHAEPRAKKAPKAKKAKGARAGDWDKYQRE